MNANAYLLSFPVDFKISRHRIIYSHHIVVTVESDRFFGAGSGVLYQSTVLSLKRAWDKWLRAALEDLSVNRHSGGWQTLVDRLTIEEPGLAFAVDSALWDLLGQREEQSLAQMLGGVRCSRIPITEQIFIEDWSDSECELSAIQKRGTRSLKVKTGFRPDKDLELIKRLRKSLGQEMAIRIDANRAYRLEASVAALYREMKRLGVLAVEEPISDRNVSALSRLRRETGLPVMLDESILSLKDLRAAMDAQALDILNIKLTRVGGISNALKYIDLCRQADVAVSIGCSEDIGPGMASILHLAAATEPLYSTEGMGNLRLNFDIVNEPLSVSQGLVEVPLRSGLGVTLIQDIATKIPRDVCMLDLSFTSPLLIKYHSQRMRQHQRAVNALYRFGRSMHKKP